jgi:hypothetical protein
MKDDISEDEILPKSLVVEGYNYVPSNNLKCYSCGFLVYFKSTPKKHSLYECTNYKAMFVIEDIEDNDDEQGTIIYRRIPDKYRDKVFDILNKMKKE